MVMAHSFRGHGDVSFTPMTPHGGGPSSYRPPEMTQDTPRISFLAGRRPVPNCALTPVDHLGNNAHVNTARSIKNGLGLQLHQNKRVATLLPPQKNIPPFLRHINKHARILYHAPCNFHLTQLWNAILFNVGHTRPAQGVSWHSSTNPDEKDLILLLENTVKRSSNNFPSP